MGACSSSPAPEFSSVSVASPAKPRGGRRPSLDSNLINAHSMKAPAPSSPRSPSLHGGSTRSARSRSGELDTPVNFYSEPETPMTIEEQQEMERIESEREERENQARLAAQIRRQAAGLPSRSPARRSISNSESGGVGLFPVKRISENFQSGKLN